MPIQDLKNIAKSVGVSVRGTKKDIVDRYELAFDTEKKKLLIKPTLSQLKSLTTCNSINNSARTKNQYLDVLAKNEVEWNYMPHEFKKELQNSISHGLCSYSKTSLAKQHLCDICGATQTGLQKHSNGGHIDITDKLIIKHGQMIHDLFELSTFDTETDKLRDVMQLVFIPWYERNSDGNEVLKNVSVGVTRCGNVNEYANGIWNDMQYHLKNQTIYLYACGSARGVVHRLKWYMKANDARSFNIRELIGAVHVLSASDEFGYLTNCEPYLVERVRECLCYMADVNESNCENNLKGVNSTSDNPKLRRFYLSDPNNVLKGEI